MKRQYDKNSTEASLVESYTYYITDGFDEESFRRKMYTFELLRGSDGWKITNVTTDDHWETDDKFEYTPIDVEGAVKAQLAKPELKSFTSTTDEKEKHKADSQASPTSKMHRWKYDTAAAVAYAKKHYNDTNDKIFGYSGGEGGNCQNFASQCVWAGLGGSGTEKTALPAVPRSRVNLPAFNVWCAGHSTDNFYDYYEFNWPWDNVCGFSKLMVKSTTTAEGPFGNTSYQKGIENAAVGNVLVADWNGAPSEKTLDHAMFVTQVSGTAGSRDKTNVKIAAHTSHTNSAFQTVASYTQAQTKCFGRAVIYSGYYKVEQQ